MTFLIQGNGQLLHLSGFYAKRYESLIFQTFGHHGSCLSQSQRRYERFNSSCPPWVTLGDKIRTIDHELMIIDWLVDEVALIEGQWRMFGHALRWRRSLNQVKANARVLTAIAEAGRSTQSVA